jgi:hypothetical protein
MWIKRIRSGSITLLGLMIVLTVFNYPRVRGFLLSTPSSTEQRLQSRLTKVQFDNVPLRKALDAFSKGTGLKFEANWEALEALHAGANHRVRLRLENVTVAVALDKLLRAGLRPEFDSPAYDVLPDGRILIGEPEDMTSCYVTRLYDLRDLVDGELRFREGIEAGVDVEDELARRQAEADAAAVAQAAAAKGGIFGSTTAPATAPSTAPATVTTLTGGMFGRFIAQPPAASRIADAVATVMDEYAELVSGLAPVPWDSIESTVQANGRFLVITARPWGHRQIEEFLAEMRRTNTPIRRIKPEPNQFERRKEGRRGGSGFFGG